MPQAYVFENLLNLNSHQLSVPACHFLFASIIIFLLPFLPHFFRMWNIRSVFFISTMFLLLLSMRRQEGIFIMMRYMKFQFFFCVLVLGCQTVRLRLNEFLLFFRDYHRLVSNCWYQFITFVLLSSTCNFVIAGSGMGMFRHPHFLYGSFLSSIHNHTIKYQVDDSAPFFVTFFRCFPEECTHVVEYIIFFNIFITFRVNFICCF